MTSFVEPDVFRERMAPTVAAMRDFATAVQQVGERHGRLPDANSPAMTELADEQHRARSSWKTPVTDAHLFGAMTLLAATDYVRGFAELFDSERPPLYAHLAVARSALESAVVSEWLNEPGIGSLERIKRGLCELLYSAGEVDKLGLSPKPGARRAEWKAVVDGFGWSLAGRVEGPIITDRERSEPVNRTKRPRISEGIVRLVGNGDESRIGDLLYSRLAAVTHVTWFGLEWVLDLSGATRDERSGLARVSIAPDTGQISGIAFYAVRALRSAATARVTLMGWNDAQWQDAACRAIALEKDVLEAALSASRAPRESV